jgi:aminoglycoside phosphotransferase (APT) family kinase protein
MTGIAGSADELSREWLTEALGTEVRSVTVEPIGTGQTSSTYRLTLDADGCARTLVAKLAEGSEDARRRVATAHRNEIGFYRQLAPALRVRAPDCQYAAISDDGTSFTLLLEDLAPRRPGRQADGCSFADATKAVESLARLHASRWNDPSVNEINFLVPLTEDRAAFLADLAQTATDQFVTRYADQLDAEDALTLHAAAEVLFEWQVSNREPFSLVHGDYRLDNLMLDPAGGDVVVVDWQTVTVAFPGRDLGYFIGTSLPAAQRRAEEGQLVSTYHEALQLQGVLDYPFDRCWTDYRVGQLQGPMITVIGSMTSVGPRSPLADAMFLSMAQRSCAAVRDHHSIEAA